MLIGLVTTTVFGAELKTPVISGVNGEIVKLPVTVDKVEKLAGIKLGLAYDTNILKFIKVDKTSYTANMLHVVNDRMPGKLIIVMASAKGFAGVNADLVEISFELLKDVKPEDKLTLKITEVELMGDDLKKIDVKFH